MVEIARGQAGGWCISDVAGDVVLLKRYIGWKAACEPEASRPLSNLRPWINGDHVAKQGQSEGEALKLVYEDDIVEISIHAAYDTQAAAYTRARVPRCSAQQYYAEIQQSRSSRTSLLRCDVPLPDRDRDACNSVLLTWQISSAHISQIQPSAAELLSFMSLYDRGAILESLFVAFVEGLENVTNASQVEGDIVLLRSFSFVVTTHDPKI
nr:hypothetical protein CFP56_03182 [Quercus suber]